MSSVVFHGRQLSFKQWRIWVVLGMAALCGYLSLSIHNTHKDLIAVDGLVGALSSLKLDSREVPNDPNNWLISTQHLMPSLILYVQDSATEVQKSLDTLIQKILRVGSAPLAEQIRVRRQLSWVEATLRVQAAQLTLRSAQITHVYYLAVIVFILVMSAFVRWRWTYRRHSELHQYLKDTMLFANVPVALSVSDGDDNLLRVNSAYEELTGFQSADVLGKRAFTQETEEEQLNAQRMQADLDEEGCWFGHYPIRSKDGSAHSEKVMRVRLGEGDQPAQGYLTLSLEVAKSDAEQRLMLWQAHHDNLTKLPNANLLEDRLAHALLDDKRGALICLDLDKFKDTNDSIGYAGADRVLIEAAHRIAMTSQEGDTVARIGGDLFVIVVPEFSNIAEIEHAARAAIEAIEPAFVTEQGELFITASAGVVIFPDDGKTSGELQQKANTARQKAKRQGGNQLQFFETQMNELAGRRFELECNLRKALELQEFELHFQPVIDIANKSIYGAEALLRWRSDQLGMVSPAEFIPIAETSGLIVEIGKWVVCEVQRHLEMWQESFPDLRISLNVSAKQLDTPEHAKDLLDLLGSGFGDQITVELTESILIQEDSAANDFLQSLQALNVQVALDDFGTGYSSVGYLRDYEFNLLKVDKSFIDGIDEARDLGLVASIVAMGRILGMRVVAEGVEDASQLHSLQSIGCDFVQGYYFSKPLPANEFEQFLEQGVASMDDDTL